MTARDDVRREYIIGALREAGAMYEDDARNYLAEHDAARRAEVLREEAAELKAHCLEHNQFAPAGFMDCPCRVADELLRRVKVAGSGE